MIRTKYLNHLLYLSLGVLLLFGIQIANASGPNISSVQAINVYSDGAQLTWITDVASNSAVYYGTSPSNLNTFSSFGCDSGGMVTEHCVFVSGLTVGTVYYYEVLSTDANSDNSESDGHQFTAGQDDSGGQSIPPPPPSGDSCPSGFHYHSDSGGFCINDADDYSGTCYNSDGSLIITCPTPGTGASACDSYTSSESLCTSYPNCNWFSDNTGNYCYYESDETPPPPGPTPPPPGVTDTTAPVISNVQALNIISDGAQIDWTTDEQADSMVRYGTGSGNYSFNSSWRCDAGGLVTSHCINLTNLLAGTTYYYTVESSDQSSNLRVSREFLFTSGTGGGTGPGGGGEGSLDIDFNNTFPQDGDSGVGINSIVHVQFNTEINTTTVDNNSFKLFNIATPGAYIDGVFNFLSNASGIIDAFEFIPSSPLSSNTTYSYRVDSTIHSISGYTLPSPFQASFTTGASITASPAEVNGVVTESGGNPVVNASVEVHTPDWSLVRRGRTDATGSYTVLNIPPGSYLIDVFSPEGVSGLLNPPPENITLASGEVLSKNFVFSQATKTIRGIVLDPDGSPIDDASVGAYQQSTNTWTDVRTGSTGNYTLTVSSGTWEINLRPADGVDTSWSYPNTPTTVSFSAGSETEEEIINFTVVPTDARVKGKILLPNGTPPADYTSYINFRNSVGVEFGGDVQSNGSFDLSLTAGTYSISVYNSDPTLGSPNLAQVTIATGETKDIGTIVLVGKNDSILGTVFDQSGNGVEDVRVMAWKRDGDDFAETKTNSSGTYLLAVSPGEWEVNAEPSSARNLYNPDRPQRVTVLSGLPKIVNFILLSAGSGISGVVKTADGNILSNIYGFVELSIGTGFGGGIGGSIDRGKFSIKAPAGTYIMRVFFPPDTSYSAGTPQTVTLLDGQTISVDVVVSSNNSTITGAIQDESGNILTGLEAHVFATSRTGVWQEAIFNKNTGIYTIKVSSGTWYLGFDIGSDSGFVSGREPNIEVVIGDGESVVKNLIVKKAGAIILGRVTDPLGNAVSNAYIGVSETGFASAIEDNLFKDPTVAGAETDSNGNYRVAVPAGSYFVKTFVNPERGFINSDERSITILDGETKTLNLKLRRADLVISGFVFANDVPVRDAFVWGWSEKGGYQESFTRFDGSYRLNVTASDKWVVAAKADIGGVIYKSNAVPVLVEDENLEHDIYLERFKEIPAAVVKTTRATESTVTGVPGGATVVASGNAISNEGSVSISVTPDTRAPSQGGVQVVGTAYDLEARDESGQIIASFNTDVTITIPYDEAELKNLGALESNLVLSFWDEASATWIILENSIVNLEENTVTASIDHFTRFAIVAAADITPPAQPAGVAVSIPGTGIVQLSWTNSGSDFSHSKIYRSLEEGVIGGVLVSEVLGEVYTDTTVLDGVTYFYTVRAVDAAGNETSNTDQVSITAEGTGTGKTKPPKTIPKGQGIKLQILRSLTIGSTGDDVTLLQQFLVDEGVYPEGLITGYFGNLTRGAVIRFQEKYAKDILAPVDLTSGSGFFGPSTRKKFNELNKSGLITTGLPVSSSISVNLSVGDKRSEVTVLQQFLLDEGVYPEGLITGYFGNLTRQAVIRFQEKYAKDILAPVDLTSGSGFFGPSTRKKFNELIK